MAVDYDSNLEELKKFFEDLIIIEYKTERNKKLIDLLVELVYSNMLIQRIENETVDVDNSIGAQLDVVGKWVGVDRLYNNIDFWTRKYFAMPSYYQIRNNAYNEFQGGMSTYTDFATVVGAWLMYDIYREVHNMAYSLGDSYFRFVIRIKIISNSINHCRKDIDEAIYNLTNGEIYTTWEKMGIIYNIPEKYNTVMTIANNKKILPCPTGCSITINVV